MDTTVMALQNLYVALGGELTDTYDTIASGAPVSDYVVIPDVINAIAQIAVPAELPKVSKSDNGEVLTVVNGAWAKADAPEELPKVSASDNGSVLKVVDGAWAVGTDNVE